MVEFRPRSQFPTSVFRPNPAAHHHQRARALLEQVDHVLDFLLGRSVGGGRLAAGRVPGGGLGLEQISREGCRYRSGGGGAGRLHRPRHHGRDFVCAADFHSPFGERGEEVLVVHFLERSPSSVVAADLSDEQQQRSVAGGGVEHGDRRMRCARTAGDEASGRSAGEAGLRLCHVGRGGFVPANHESYAVLVPEGVKDGQETLAWHSENRVYTLDTKLIH